MSSTSKISKGAQYPTGPKPDGLPKPIRWWGRTSVRLTVCFVFVATVPLAITAIYTTQRHLGVVRAMAARAAAERAATAANALAELINSASNDTLAVTEWLVLHSYLASKASAKEHQFWREKLRVQVQTFMELNTPYKAIRFVEAEGRTLLRMERRGTALDVVTDTKPEHAASYDWIGAAATLLPRQTHWRVPRGDTGESVACMARVPRIASEQLAAVILEIDMRPTLGSLEAAADQRHVLVVDREGRRLFETGGSTGPDAWGVLEPGQFVDPAARLVSVAAVATTGEPSGWLLAIAEPASVLELGVADYRTAFLVVLMGSLLVALVLGVWLSLQVTRPVRHLYEASRRIGLGDFNVSLPDEADDELGALSAQVRRMASEIREAHESFEQRLREKTDELLQADRLATIGRTAAAVAHEINNPSGIISLYTQMLSERLPADDPNVPKLRVIEAKAREISQIVRELLDYARKPAPVREWVDVRALVNGAVAEATCVVEPNEPSAPISTKVNIDPDLSTIHVDPHQVTRMIRNLVSNALHAMPEGGTLTVSCHRDGDTSTVIEISDTGIGIAPEQSKHLFDPFHSTKRFGAGTGLGLAISKEIIERHRGSISVASEPGRGTTVTVRLRQNAEDGELRG